MDSKPKDGIGDASFQAAGGEEGLRLLVDRFYEGMEKIPAAKSVRDMHKEDLTEVRDKLARFLCGWLGGPKRYNEKYGPISIPLSHQPFSIGSAERDAWLLCMRIAVEAQPYEQSFKKYLMEQLAFPAERVRNRE
ncbi:MAG: group II truncated hemoglobin [Bdellovibrionota bacterium]